MKVCLMIALAIVINLQTQLNGQTTSRGIKVESVNDAIRLFPNVQSPAPTAGAPYTISHGWVGENQLDGTSLFFFGLNPDPITMAINDAIMDGDADTIGEDLSAAPFGNPMNNPVVAHECLESLGPDPAGSGRFLMRLTVTVEATGTGIEFDSLTIDNQDPLDGDMDGETGKGPDGLYFTADDVIAPDGFNDSGDGTLDATFPLDPPGLALAFDADGDGDATNDAPTPVVGNGFILGLGGGNPIAFDPAGGPVTVQSALWELRDVNGDIADIDGDAMADGPFDITAFANFTAAVDGGWDGTMGVILGADGNFCSTTEGAIGSVRTNQLVVEYLSDIEPPLFCFSGNDMGCDGPSTFLRFRGVDVGTPALGDFGDIDGTAAMFNPGFVLNDTEAPVWIICDYAATAGGSIDVTSNAGTPGLTMTAEYADPAGGPFDFITIDTAAESFNSFTTESFAIPAGVAADRVRIGWRQTGFVINFPWEVRIDAIQLCQ